MELSSKAYPSMVHRSSWQAMPCQVQVQQQLQQQEEEIHTECLICWDRWWFLWWWRWNWWWFLKFWGWWLFYAKWWQWWLFKPLIAAMLQFRFVKWCPLALVTRGPYSSTSLSGLCAHYFTTCIIIDPRFISTALQVTVYLGAIDLRSCSSRFEYFYAC